MSQPTAPNPYEIMQEACRRLQLKPFETKLMLDCLHAWALVSNGNLLITPRRVPAARRMIERGYLAQSPHQTEPFDPVGFGLVVVAEGHHLNKLIDDAKAVTP